MAGLVLVGINAWRVGVVVVGLGFGLAFVMRLVLPDNHAACCGSSRRLVDLATLALCSGVMLAMAILIPNRPNQR